MKVFNKQAFLFFVLIFAGTFFFWNLSLYSDRLCQQQIDKLEGEKTAIHSKAISDLQQAKEEKAGLQSQLKELALLRDAAEAQLQHLKWWKQQQQQTGASPPVGNGIPVIIFAYNRPQYLRRTLTTLFKYAPPFGYPIIVSQDAHDESVRDVVYEFPNVIHLQHLKRDDPVKQNPGDRDSYYYISQHYKFGLHNVFDNMQFDTVIILEDDLEIAPDFFSYFTALAPMLHNDSSLLCVSAWNDNGQTDFVRDAHKVRRSNFFPGLGWMLTRAVWNELKHKWPGAFWDDWLREPEQKRNRDCIHPEISRTYTFGKEGSSGGQFFDQYLGRIRLNTENVDWSRENLNHLKKDNYDAYIEGLLADARELSGPIYGAKSQLTDYQNKTVVFPYRTEGDFVALANAFGVMNDFKAGVPRTAYRGVVMFHSGSNLVLLAPRAIVDRIKGRGEGDNYNDNGP